MFPVSSWQVWFFLTKFAHKGNFRSKTGKWLSCVRSWLLLTILNFSIQRPTDTTVFLMFLLLLVPETIINTSWIIFSLKHERKYISSFRRIMKFALELWAKNIKTFWNFSLIICGWITTSKKLMIKTSSSTEIKLRGMESSNMGQKNGCNIAI